MQWPRHLTQNPATEEQKAYLQECVHHRNTGTNQITEYLSRTPAQQGKVEARLPMCTVIRDVPGRQVDPFYHLRVVANLQPDEMLHCDGEATAKGACSQVLLVGLPESPGVLIGNVMMVAALYRHGTLL